MIRHAEKAISWCVSFCVLFCLMCHAFGQASAVPRQNETENAAKNWHFGSAFIAGFAPFHTIHSGFHYGESLNFYSAGFQAGRTITATHGPGWTAGHGEMVFEVLPFWYARIPKQTVTIDTPNGDKEEATIGPSGWHGVTVTPLLFRWNLTRLSSGKMMPYGQLGSGLLWTSLNFPQGGGGSLTTSQINFTPQVGFGTNLFTRPRQSANFDIKVIHISSAGIGNYNPGVNVTLQFGVGYSWWK
jgi:lipid A 3-O-deacylase